MSIGIPGTAPANVIYHRYKLEVTAMTQSLCLPSPQAISREMPITAGQVLLLGMRVLTASEHQPRQCHLSVQRGNTARPNDHPMSCYKKANM